MAYVIPQKKAPLKPNSKPFKDSNYLSWLHEVKQVPCYVCNIQVGIQLHHIKRASSDPKKDNLVIHLCYEHHLGTEFSAHGTPKAFKEEYPYEMQEKRADSLYAMYKGE